MIEPYSLLLVTAMSLVSSLLLTPVVRDGFLKMGILDLPDGRRKIHRMPIPRVGGIPITFSYLIAFGVLLALPGGAGSFMQQQLPFVVKLLPAAGVVFVTGLLDDVFGLKPWQKVAGQVAGAILAAAAGVRIAGLAGYELNAWLGVALTIVWLVGCANAFNLIDGLDGLSAGMGLLATITIFVAALLHGNHALVLATLPLAGALLGFLRYNFNPASVFLGDSGSLLIGFLLGCFGAIWSQKSATLLGMMAPVMAMAIPLLDTGLSIVRRWLSGRPIFGGDRNHIHHKLLDRGLPHKRVVLILYAVCSVYAVLSLMQSVVESRFGGLVVVLFCAITWMGIQNLGYFEFGVAGRALFGGTLRKVVHGHISIHGFQSVLARATTVEEFWAAIHVLGSELGFSHIGGYLRGRHFGDAEMANGTDGHWQLRIPLSPSDYVVVSRRLDAPPVHGVVMAMIEVIARSGGRLASLSPAQSSAPAAASISSLLGLAASVGSIAPAEERISSQ